MPLIKGKSEKSFKKNLETEMHAGKPQKQALAIAYAMKRKAKKMAHGGDTPGPVAPEQNEPMDKKSRAMQAFANGGEAFKGVHAPLHGEHQDKARDKGESESGYQVRRAAHNMPEIGSGRSALIPAKEEHKKVLSELRSMPKPKLMADGGEAESNPNSGWSQKDKEDFSKGASQGSTTSASDAMNNISNSLGSLFEAEGGDAMHGEQSDDHEMDMVERIMHRRAKMMSEGGIASNEGEGEAKGHPDQMENEFDDLVLDDHLEEHETGANSGDELGNERLDHDEGDIVSRIMKSRSKRDRNPRPA